MENHIATAAVMVAALLVYGLATSLLRDYCTRREIALAAVGALLLFGSLLFVDSRYATGEGQSILGAFLPASLFGLFWGLGLVLLASLPSDSLPPPARKENSFRTFIEKQLPDFYADREDPAARGGADEAILLREEQVTEGAASNVFAVNDGVVRTPGKDGTILPGIARDVLVEALHRDGRECRESGISLPQLQTAEEIWLTSSTMQVAPVVRLDGCPVGDGRPGALWRTALELYRRRERRLSAGN